MRYNSTYLGQTVCALAAAALLTGCGGGGSKSGGGKSGNVYNYVNTDEPKHLDPAFVYDVYESIVNGLLFDGLVNFEGSEVVPGLAEKWAVSEDGTSYTFFLRNNAKFSDGKAVTSADVKYSFTRILDAKTNSDRKWVLQEIQGADELSSGTATELTGLDASKPNSVDIKLKRRFTPFLKKIAMPAAAIIPAGATDTDQKLREFDRNPVGAGPWILSKWEHDQYLEFVPNEHYWGGRPKLDKFVYNVQIDDNVQRQQYKIGRIDQYIIGFTAWDEWVKDPKRKAALVELPELNTYFVGINHSKEKFKDKRVRQAISMAINKQEIFDKVQKSRGTIANGIVPPGIEGYRPDVKGMPYDPEKAKALLAEAGVKDLSVDIWIRTEAQNDEIASIIKENLKAVGVELNIMRRDIASLRDGIYNGGTELYTYSWWLDYPDIQNALEPTLHSRNIPRNGNGAHFNNPEYDRLLDAADQENDPAKRISLYQQAEDIAIEECAWIPTYHRTSYVAVQPWVKNYKPTLMPNAMKFLNVEIDLEAKKK